MLLIVSRLGRTRAELSLTASELDKLVQPLWLCECSVFWGIFGLVNSRCVTVWAYLEAAHPRQIPRQDPLCAISRQHFPILLSRFEVETGESALNIHVQGRSTPLARNAKDTTRL